MLDDLGLIAAMEWQAREYRIRTGVHCELSIELGDLMVDAERSTALFRIFQETLTNIARHSGARNIQLALEQDGDCVVLQVKDDGRGFNESKLLSPDSLGLLGMRERALLIGAGLEIRSRPREGTMVTVVLPGAAAESNGQQTRTTRRDHTNRR